MQLTPIVHFSYITLHTAKKR